MNETHRHKFLIRNDGATRWRFARISTTCSCTVSKVLTPVIELGGVGEVEVIYKTPATTLNDRRTVTVEFAEPGAPVVSLTVAAQVREPLNVTMKTLDFGRLGRGGSPEASFEVQNFSGRDLGPLEVTSATPWFRVASLTIPIPTAGAPGSPRQAWRVTARAATSGLEPGEHRGQIALKAGEPALTQLVDVRLAIMSPVTVFPPQMFFGSIPVGATGHSKVTLRFSPDRVVKDREAIRVTHDLGDRLKLDLTRTSDLFWEVAAALKPLEDDSYIEGKVEVGFRDATLPVLVVPVRALTRRP